MGRLRVLRRLLALASATLVVSVSAGCGNTDSWVESSAAQGWSAQYSDAANTSYTATAGSATLQLSWSRSVKGSLDAGAALGAGSYLAVNGQTPGGCSLMVWENDNNGRQRWCTRMVLGGGFASPLFDQFDNLYIGQPGLMLSYPPTQWVRWREHVIGMPTTTRFLGSGQLLVVTHLGQVLVFESHRGVVTGTPMDLVEGLDPRDATRGLDDCPQALPQCPVSAPPAFSAAGNMIVVGVWQPDAKASVLIGLQYHPGQTPLITKEWASDAVAAGVLAAPVLSRDGRTLYVNGRDRHLWALNSADGKVKWSVPLDFQPQTPPSVSPSGTIVAGGGPIPAWSDSKTPATTPRWCGAAMTSRRWPPRARPVPRWPTPWSPRPLRASPCWCSTWPMGAPSTATRCRWPTATRSGCPWATTAALWWPPAAGQVYSFAPA